MKPASHDHEEHDMRTLFTAYTSAIADPIEQHDALEALRHALREEFPAYYVSETTRGDYAAALVVEPFEREVATKNGSHEVPIPAHLNGWGHGPLTLKLVA